MESFGTSRRVLTDNPPTEGSSAQTHRPATPFLPSGTRPEWSNPSRCSGYRQAGRKGSNRVLRLHGPRSPIPPGASGQQGRGLVHHVGLLPDAALPLRSRHHHLVPIQVETSQKGTVPIKTRVWLYNPNGNHDKNVELILEALNGEQKVTEARRSMQGRGERYSRGRHRIAGAAGWSRSQIRPTISRSAPNGGRVSPRSKSWLYSAGARAREKRRATVDLEGRHEEAREVPDTFAVLPISRWRRRCG